MNELKRKYRVEENFEVKSKNSFYEKYENDHIKPYD